MRRRCCSSLRMSFSSRRRCIEAEEERSKLDKLNIPYLVISYGNMAEQMYALSVIGAASGEKYAENARKINSYYCDVIRRVCRARRKFRNQREKQSIIPSMRLCAQTERRVSE